MSKTYRISPSLWRTVKTMKKDFRTQALSVIITGKLLRPLGPSNRRFDPPLTTRDELDIMEANVMKTLHDAARSNECIPLELEVRISDGTEPASTEPRDAPSSKGTDECSADETS